MNIYYNITIIIYAECVIPLAVAVAVPPHKLLGIYNIKRYIYIVDIIIMVANIVIMQNTLYEKYTLTWYRGFKLKYFTNIHLKTNTK